MTWSYNGDPSASPKDAVRFLLGDTDSTDELTLSDEEIAYLLSTWDNDSYFAAAAGAEQLAGQYAREVSYASDGVNYSGDELQQKFIQLAQRLRWQRKRMGQSAVPYDGSNDPAYNDWRNQVEEIGIGMHDSRRDGANADEDEVYYNPLTGSADGGYATA